MLDRYISGDAERISPEAPVPVVRVVEEQDRVGGAGSVALNVQALGATALCYGVIGEDAAGGQVRALLRAAGAETSGILTVQDRPTITKARVIGLAEHRHRQQILRIDYEVVRPLAPADSDQLRQAAESALQSADVLCLEDYAKGVLSEELTQALIRSALRQQKPVLIDPARTRAWEKYRGATLLTPNRVEFETAAGQRLSDDELTPAGLELIRRYDLGALVVTLGRDGALLLEASGVNRRFPTVPRAVYDNTGAGDAVLAMLATALAAGGKLEQAVVLANIAGGLEVSKFGCVPIRREEVQHELDHGPASDRGKILGRDELAAELAARKQRGESVVFTNGVFDILHPGHIELLRKARAFGSVLVVAINSDASVRSLNKGADRPLRSQADRARMLAGLSAVDYVVVFEEPDPRRLLQALRPDVLVKGGDYSLEGVVGHEIVLGYGGRVERIPFVQGYSTTSEVERIRQAEENVRSKSETTAQERAGAKSRRAASDHSA